MKIINKYLSKSDFQLASSCPKKLVYKKSFYPTANDSNEYMEMLAQGGYIVGKMATILFPEGIEVEGNTNDCIEHTQNLLKKENVVLFEPAILSGQKLVRIDILVKQGNSFHLIEVKAKSHNTEEQLDKAKIKKYIEDVAYQYTILKEAFPDSKIKCSLLMPDKAKRTSIDELAGWFSIDKQDKKNDNEIEELPAQQKPAFNKPEVVFKYEAVPNKEEYIVKLSKEGILAYQDVTEAVEEMQNDINQRASAFLRILNEGINNEDYQISKGCKACEFNTPDKEKNGYKECWGNLAYTKPNIFDLYYGGSIGHYKKGYYFDELITEGKTNLFDIDPERLKNSKGELGARGTRQLLQIENTRNNTEWFSNELKSISENLKYPLHFIDFETYTGALPFHKGMRPYELIAFQWSCHTILKPGATPLHSEWIHTGLMYPNPNEFPNFEFARSLKNQIGTAGTPLMWATHENTVLRTIMNQMDVYGVKDEELSNWLFDITSEGIKEGRLIDMNKMTQEYYFHPYMKGKTSIKKVLPAVWSHHSYLHQVEHFKDYVPDKFLGGILDPYDTLTSGLNEVDWDDDVVSGGTAAMRAYHRIRFDETLTNEQKNELRFQLLQYCKLDTMAMVIIAYHWGIK
jgi:hypothetical protein